MLGAGVSYLGFQYYIEQREQRAHQAFAEAATLYEQIRAGKQPSSTEPASTPTIVDWQEVELAFKAGHAQNSGSYLAPYFLVFQVEAIAQQGRIEEAVALLSTVLKQITVASPFYPQFELKRALLQLDSDSAQMMQEGLQNVERIAGDTDHQMHETAAYFLGEYYWAQEDFAKAGDAYRLVRAPVPGQLGSEWYALAQEKVAQL